MRGLKSTLLLIVLLGGLVAYIYFVDANRDPAAVDALPRAFDVTAENIEALEIRNAEGETIRLQKVDEAWQLIAAARLPVMLHATAVYGVDGGDEYCGVDAIRALLARHPDLTLVIAHIGMPEHRDARAAHEASARGSGAIAGPVSTSPVGAKREPWQGQSQLVSSAFQWTMQPRWVHTADRSWSTPASSR